MCTLYKIWDGWMSALERLKDCHVAGDMLGYDVLST